MAEDVRQAWHTRERADQARVDLFAGSPGGARVRGGGRAPGTGTVHVEVVEGRTAWRLPRLQPEREGPHRRRRVFRAADAGRARVGAAGMGRSRAGRTGRFHDGDDAETI